MTGKGKFLDAWRLLALFDRCEEIARASFDAPSVSVKEDLSVVTDADRAIENELGRTFDRPEEGSFMLGEETLARRGEDYLASALRGRAWVVDPIDGTAPYSTHVMLWGTSIGLMEQGRIVAGGVLFPAESAALIADGNELIHARRSGNGWRMEPMKFSPAEFSPRGHIGISQRCAHLGRVRIANQLFAWSGCVASFYYLLTGRLLAYQVSCNLYDMAGVLPIAEAGGFVVRNLHSGEKITCENILQHVRTAPGPHRWAFNDDMLVAPSEQVCEAVAPAFELPERFVQ